MERENHQSDPVHGEQDEVSLTSSGSEIHEDEREREGRSTDINSCMNEMNLDKKPAKDVIKSIQGVLDNAYHFSSCGSLKLSEPIDIYYKAKGTDANGTCNIRHIRLPASDSDLQDLTRECEVASFGIGDRDVVDEKYRKALCLPKSRFSSSFDLCSTGILHTVQYLLAHDCPYIVAEPYKLNIYEKGGFFKVHKDTPRGQ
jgi:hypothetical protein